MTEPIDHHRIAVDLDKLLAARGITLVELSAHVGVTVANLSILKNGRAKAIRFSTLTRLCQALGCQPADLLSYTPNTDQPAALQPSPGPPSHRDTPSPRPR